MGNISSNIGTAQTLRQFIGSFAGGTISAKDNKLSGATDVNVIWDGDSYYIAYKNSANNYVIDDITGYLPLTITPASTTT